MNDYQMPLFDRYPMSVEFDRHWRYVTRSLASVAPGPDEDEAIILMHSAKVIEPLNMFPDLMRLEPINHRAFEAHVPYEGDDELWHLYPGKIHLVGVLGEVFRAELLLTASAANEDAARIAFEIRVQQIEDIHMRQKWEINAFVKSLPQRVRTELGRLRGRGPS